MSYNSTFSRGSEGKVKKKKKWLKIVLITVAVLLVAGGLVAWKAGNILNKISIKGNLFSSLVHSIPGVPSVLNGEKDDRINILLLGMRGQDMPGGGLLTDTIMVASIEPKANKIALISIPRDLWVQDPGKDSKSKINAVYTYGEEKGTGGGIKDMETTVGDITGLTIDYSVVMNFAGFTKLIDTLGGVQVDLSKPFDESAQFQQPQVCDSFFTQPTGTFQTKTKKIYSSITGAYERTRVTAQYPLCTAPVDTEDCGGDFKLPAGKNTLTGAQVLCFVRSRDETSDFERAKRQQVVLQQVEQKAKQLGILDFGKINSILNDLGDNVRTDMQAWEMKRLFDLYKGMNSPQLYQRVLEDSQEGLLYAPQETPETGYILLPIGDNYDQIKNLFQNIFTLPAQSDIKPQI